MSVPNSSSSTDQDMGETTGTPGSSEQLPRPTNADLNSRAAVDQALVQTVALLQQETDLGVREVLLSRINALSAALAPSGAVSSGTATRQQRQQKETVVQLAKESSYKECGILDIDDPNTIPRYFTRFEETLKVHDVAETRWIDELLKGVGLSDTVKNRVRSLVSEMPPDDHLTGDMMVDAATIEPTRYQKLIKTMVKMYGWTQPHEQVSCLFADVKATKMSQLRDSLEALHKDYEWVARVRGLPSMPIDNLATYVLRMLEPGKSQLGHSRLREWLEKNEPNVFEKVIKSVTDKDLKSFENPFTKSTISSSNGGTSAATAAINAAFVEPVGGHKRRRRFPPARGANATPSIDKRQKDFSADGGNVNRPQHEWGRQSSTVKKRKREIPCPICGKLWCDKATYAECTRKRLALEADNQQQRGFNDKTGSHNKNTRKENIESYTGGEPKRHKDGLHNRQYMSKVRLNACLNTLNAMIPIDVGGTITMALTDSGACRSFISSILAKTRRKCDRVMVELADGSLKFCDEESVVMCTIGGKMCNITFLVMDGLSCDCIIGFEELSKLKISIHPAKNYIKMDGRHVKFLPRKMANKLAKMWARGSAEKYRKEMENPDIMAATRDKLAKRIEANLSTSDREAPRNRVVYDKNLDEATREKVRLIVDSLADCFISKERPIGHVEGLDHRHRVQPSGKPFKLKVKPLSPLMIKEQKEQIALMLKHGIIRPSKGEWACIPCFAPKKDGTWRFCINFRPINKRCVADSYPLPRAPDLLETFQGCRFFTKLDAAHGYWQIPIHPDDTKYCSFICQEGQFEYVRMPFGLMNAPATYQRMNDTVLEPFLRKTCVVYLDDVIVYSKTFEEHEVHVREVMAALKTSGQLLRPEKCDFFLQECDYLGHIVGSGGLRMNEDKHSKILKFPVPEDKKQLKRFLGIVSYYRKFVKNLAAKTTLLRQAEIAPTFVWTPECQIQFDNILADFNENVVLAHPDYSKEFHIECDASDAGVGAVLAQLVDVGGRLTARPVLFASRALTKGEKKWPPREKEGLAIVWAVQQFRHHIHRTHFTVYSDHQSLEWLMSAEVGKLARWAMLLAEYEPFTIRYKSGAMNKAADALSRIYEPSELLPEIATCFRVTEVVRPSLSQGSIPDTNPAITVTRVENWVLSQKALTPSKELLYQKQRSDTLCLQRFIKPGKDQVIVDSLIGVKRGGTRFKPIVPDEMVDDLIKAHHVAAAHMGVKRTMYKVGALFTVKRLRDKCRKIVMACEVCRARKEPIQRAGWLASKPAENCWDQVAMDFAGPYPETSDGKKYVLVMIDQFSKYVELVATEKNDAATVVNAFHDRIICRHGTPKRLLTDNHRQFKNASLDAVCHAYGCFKSYCSKYYPQGDGHVERFMRNLNDTLSILCDGTLEEWDVYIPSTQWAYNTTTHSVTGCTPFEVNHARLPSTPYEVTYEERAVTDKRTQSATHYARRLKNVSENIRERARLNIARGWLSAAKAYNRLRKQVKVSLGDHVMIRLTPALRTQMALRGKLPPRWSRPMRVVATRQSGKAFEVEDPQNGDRHVVNISRMLPIPDKNWRPDTQHLKEVLGEFAELYQGKEVPDTFSGRRACTRASSQRKRQRDERAVERKPKRTRLTERVVEVVVTPRVELEPMPEASTPQLLSPSMGVTDEVAVAAPAEVTNTESGGSTGLELAEVEKETDPYEALFRTLQEEGMVDRDLPYVSRGQEAVPGESMPYAAAETYSITPEELAQIEKEIHDFLWVPDQTPHDDEDGATAEDGEIQSPAQDSASHAEHLTPGTYAMAKTRARRPQFIRTDPYPLRDRRGARVRRAGGADVEDGRDPSGAKP